MPKPATTPATQNPHHQARTPVPALTGASFPTLPAPLTVATQFSAQLYPLGQHPPPLSAAQLYHPVAQLPAPALAAAELVIPVVAPLLLEPALTLAAATVAPAGAATVTPLLTTTVPGEGGHEVCAQSLPTWQQPPR